ncbi:hypothetical protein K7H20_24345 [Salipiger manganoxidans]|uniref:hypothetical protein n=1 Tax=Salipiger marinus TaxID=555512 RepID=UPI001E5A4358|nr:hypothetical protein [Salipiger manganoxidans]MCD1621173.1 hypothetical protein [Salipiger manganoxidans]
MARKPKTPRAAPASSAAEVRVMMTAAFTYQLGPSARRTLPAGWSGMVPAAIATRVEAEKAGARVAVEEEGDAVTTKPLKPAATIPAEPSPAAPAAAEPGSPAAPATPAAPETGGASVGPKVGSAEGNQPSVSAAPEAGTAPAPSDDTGA